MNNYNLDNQTKLHKKGNKARECMTRDVYKGPNYSREISHELTKDNGHLMYSNWALFNSIWKYLTVVSIFELVFWQTRIISC